MLHKTVEALPPYHRLRDSPLENPNRKMPCKAFSVSLLMAPTDSQKIYTKNVADSPWRFCLGELSAIAGSRDSRREYSVRESETEAY